MPTHRQLLQLRPHRDQQSAPKLAQWIQIRPGLLGLHLFLLGMNSTARSANNDPPRRVAAQTKGHEVPQPAAQVL